MLRPLIAAGHLLILVFLVACGSAGGAPGGGAGPGGEAIVLDWTAGAEAAPVSLDNGWTVGDCGGDAPLRCVREGDRVIGVIELLAFAEPDIPHPGDEAAGVAWLEARVEAFHTALAAARAAGCGRGYEYRPRPTQRVDIGGNPAVEYGFSGYEGGRESERRVNYQLIYDGQLWIIAAGASHAEGCLASELIEFTPAQFEEFEPYLERLARGSVLPASS